MSGVTRQASDVWEKDGEKFVRCSCGTAQQLGPFTARHVGTYRVGGKCGACGAEITIEPKAQLA